MKRRGLLAYVTCAAILLQAASAAHVTYLDGDSFFKTAAADVLTAHGVSGVLSALLNVETSAQSQPGVSQQVEKVLSSNVFHRPAAVVALQVIGAGDALRQTGSSTGASQALSVDADASSLLQAVGSVVSGDTQSFLYKALDHTGLPATCDERCQAIMVMEAVEARGFNYTQRNQPSMDCDAGPWCYWVTSGEDRVLDMGLREDRLFAWELGMLRRKTLEAAAAHKAVAGEAGPPKLLEATLLGLQGLRKRYGVESPKYAAAIGMLRGTVAEIWEATCKAAGGSAIMQLASVDLRSGSDPSLDDMLQWRSQHRQAFQRRLLQQDGKFISTEFGDGLSVHWATNSTAWLISILILVFIISSAICLCNMKFEQDTLLYARPKAD
jgi:hypothetical protein